MQPRLARRLVSLYPARWRARYGAEFAAFLEDQPRTLSNITNVVASALGEHLRPMGGLTMDWRQKTLVLMAFAYLATVAAGVNFYWTVDDTPLAVTMRTHAALGVAFRTVAIGSVAAFVAVVAIAVPLTFTITLDACRGRRWGVLARIAVPFVSALVLMIWLGAAALAHDVPWVPTPWDVTGDWSAPSYWPALSTRWTMSSVTLVLMISGLVGSAAAASQVIRASDMSRHGASWFRATSVALAAALVAMTVAIAGWGWFAQQYAAAAFHARNGGFFSSTNVASWSASCAVFLLATVLALRAAAISVRRSA